MCVLCATPSTLHRRRRTSSVWWRIEGGGGTMAPLEPQRLIVGITGSSAPQLGVALLEALDAIDSVETHLVVSRGGERTIEAEMGLTRKDIEALGDVVYEPDDVAASISSGSFRTCG